jgi:hypothetical protein
MKETDLHQIRLTCLQMAALPGRTVEEAIRDAKAMVAFITNGEAPSASPPAQPLSLLNSPCIGGSPAEIRRWINVKCRLLDMTPSALAKAAGVAASTLNRFLDDDTCKHVLSSRTLEKIARVNTAGRA